eukprot:scaffold11828_cov63-Phaeocystis_antarctica.AAC.3
MLKSTKLKIVTFVRPASCCPERDATRRVSYRALGGWAVGTAGRASRGHKIITVMQDASYAAERAGPSQPAPRAARSPPPETLQWLVPAARPPPPAYPARYGTWPPGAWPRPD